MSRPHRPATVVLLLAVILSGVLSGAPLLSSPGVVHAQTLGTAAVQTPDGPELITTGSFEHGLDGWQASTVSGSAFAAAGQAHGVGAQLCHAARCHDELSTQVQLPSPAQQSFLSYRFRVDSTDTSRVCSDRLYTQLRTQAGTPIETVGVACNFDTNGWQYRRTEVSAVLTPYAGQVVQVAFVGSTAGSTPTGFTVDDVHLTARPMPLLTHQPAPLIHPLRTTRHVTSLRHAVMTQRRRSGRFHDQVSTGTKQLLDNNAFDTGNIFPWTVNGGAPGPSHLDTSRFHSAYYSLRLCGVANTTCDDLLSQEVGMPDVGFTIVTLSFWVYITSQKTSGCSDTLTARLRFQDNSTTTAQTICNQNTNGWVYETTDVTSALSPYYNQRVKVDFEGTCPNGCIQPTQFWVDDVQFTVTGPTPARWTGGNDTSSGSPAWWSVVGMSVSPLIGLSVNVANGNLLASMGETSSQGVNGLGQGVSLRYNSASRGTQTDLGYGWAFNTGRDIGLDVPSPTADIVFHDGSGYLATFTRNSDGSYTTPPGLNAQLVATIDGGYTLTENTSQEQLQFDSTGYLTAEQNRTGQRLTYHYNYSGSTNSIRDTEGRLTKMYGNAQGRIYQWTDPVYRIFNYSYDGNTNLQTVQIPGPNTTTRSYTLGYDSNHDLTNITDPLGNQTQLSYVNNGGSFQVASITRINVTNPVNPTWTFSYSSGSTTVTDPNQHSTTYTYDSLNRVTAVTDPNQHTSHTTWNSNNDVTQEQAPSGTTTTYTYSPDGRNNLTGVQLANGATESYGYTDPNWPYQATSHTDAENNTTSYTYGSPGASGAGMVTAITDALGHQSSASYNQDGTVNNSTSANGGGTTTYYNYTNTTVPNYGVALPNGVSPPAPLGSPSWQINVDNQVSVSTDGKNQNSTYSYDEMGRPTGIAQQGGTGSITYAYDAVGNQTSMLDATSPTPTTYTLNNLYQETRKTLPSGQQINSTYDGVGNLLSKSDQSGTTSYTYDPADNLKTVTDPYSQTTSFGYDQDDQETSRTYPNGVVESSGYDGAGNLTSIGARSSVNPQLTNYRYGYINPASNHVTDQRYSMIDYVTGHTSTYSYDALNRLTGVNQPWSGSGGNYSYGYDNNGNMTSSAFGTGTPTSMTYNNVDQLTSSTALGSPTYSYDANGNQLRGSAGFSQGYNWLDQTDFIDWNGDRANRVTYAGAGQSERLSNGSTNYQNDGTGLSNSTDFHGNRTAYTNTPDGDVISENIPVGQPGCMGAGGAICTYYYLHDGLGSTMALVDSTGTVQNRYAYDPWGNAIASGTTGSVPNDFQYAGAMLDSSTGLYKMGERYYDPSVGRFSQEDPAGGGYSYTGDNPINYIDGCGLSRTRASGGADFGTGWWGGGSSGSPSGGRGSWKIPSDSGGADFGTGGWGSSQSKRGRWHCTAKCQHVQHGGNIIGWTYGEGYGNSKKDAYRAAEAQAQGNAKKNHTTRHCRAIKCEKR